MCVREKCAWIQNNMSTTRPTNFIIEMVVMMVTMHKRVHHTFTSSVHRLKWRRIFHPDYYTYTKHHKFHVHDLTNNIVWGTSFFSSVVAACNQVHLKYKYIQMTNKNTKKKWQYKKPKCLIYEVLCKSYDSRKKLALIFQFKQDLLHQSGYLHTVRYTVDICIVSSIVHCSLSSGHTMRC